MAEGSVYITVLWPHNSCYVMMTFRHWYQLRSSRFLNDIPLDRHSLHTVSLEQSQNKCYETLLVWCTSNTVWSYACRHYWLISRVTLSNTIIWMDLKCSFHGCPHVTLMHEWNPHDGDYLLVHVLILLINCTCVMKEGAVLSVHIITGRNTCSAVHGITLVWTPPYAWLNVDSNWWSCCSWSCTHTTTYNIISYLHVTPIYNCNCCVIIVYSIELQRAGNVAAQASKLLANIYLIHACRCCDFGFIRYL